MNISLPHSIIEASRELTEAITRDASDKKIQKISEKLYSEFVGFISRDYFNLSTKPLSRCIVNTVTYDSSFDVKTNITTLGLSRKISKEKRAAKAITDIIHESVHCCQKAFSLSYDQESNALSYTTALCSNSLHQKSFLKNGPHTSSVTTYITNDGTNIRTQMYLAQPCEIQANTLMRKISQSLSQCCEFSKKIKENMSAIGNDKSFIELDRINSFYYNIVCSIAKIELNIHKGADYPIEKNLSLPYKEFLLSQLDGAERKNFESYKLSSSFPPPQQEDFYFLINNSDAPIDYNQFNDENNKSLEKALLTDIVLSTDANLKHMQLTIGTHQYQSPIKDINEFLFMIGEKRFIDIANYNPEKNEDYTIEELEK